MKIVDCSGSPRQIGRQAGEALRDEIRQHLPFERTDTSPQTDRRLATMTAALSRYQPEALEEMRGLAEGAGVPEEAILRLNLALWIPNELILSDGCTNVVFRDGPDGPLWGKNNDGGAPGRQRPVCALRIRPVSGIPLVAFTFCGWLGIVDGMNAEGVAIGHSSVGSVFQQSDEHAFYTAWGYYGLQRARSAQEWVQHMTERPLRGKGFSTVVVDRQGKGCSLESPCPISQVREPDTDAFYCVNCYFLPALQNADRRTPECKKDALARARFLDKAFSESPHRDIGRMQELLHSHGEPGLCRHGEACDMHTEYSMIGIPARSQILVAHGYPCRNDYRIIEVPS
jgi:isopenicillin-N N-acyltransferase-like protein